MSAHCACLASRSSFRLELLGALASCEAAGTGRERALRVNNLVNEHYQVWAGPPRRTCAARGSGIMTTPFEARRSGGAARYRMRKPRVPARIVLPGGGAVPNLSCHLHRNHQDGHTAGLHRVHCAPRQPILSHSRPSHVRPRVHIWWPGGAENMGFSRRDGGHHFPSLPSPPLSPRMSHGRVSRVSNTASRTRWAWHPRSAAPSAEGQRTRRGQPTRRRRRYRTRRSGRARGAGGSQPAERTSG